MYNGLPVCEKVVAEIDTCSNMIKPYKPIYPEIFWAYVSGLGILLFKVYRALWRKVAAAWCIQAPEIVRIAQFFAMLPSSCGHF